MAEVDTLHTKRQEPESFARQDRIVDAEGDVQKYETHKLVQEATRYGLSVQSTKDAAYFSNTALQIVAGLFPERKRETWPECEKWIYMEPVDARAFELRKQVLGDKDPDTIRSMAELATTYHEQGRYKKAEAMTVKALELRHQVLGDTHPDTIRSAADLAAIGPERRG
ncbi:hypothetical protein N7471_010325 [Penicillium samsonianum]|uniref:uncharacterized protein n=1 Tax=Penicillium samsonianum TaxID=1882272 RepID=UPI002547AACF|nr:uncharacterized protein N7471_010325 [Penicillium samsonianum]KAJ6125832.1 hypothetical protein N7471_010325 [Penicillium samsonianum]